MSAALPSIGDASTSSLPSIKDILPEQYALSQGLVRSGPSAHPLAPESNGVSLQLSTPSSSRSALSDSLVALKLPQPKTPAISKNSLDPYQPSFNPHHLPGIPSRSALAAPYPLPKFNVGSAHRPYVDPEPASYPFPPPPPPPPPLAAQSAQQNQTIPSSSSHSSSYANINTFDPFNPPYDPSIINRTKYDWSSGNTVQDEQFGVYIAGARQRQSGPQQQDRIPDDSFPPDMVNADGQYVDETLHKHVCHLCQKRFNRPSSLRLHLNTHTGARPYECPYPNCGRTFNVSSNMRRHFRNHVFPAPTTRDPVIAAASRAVFEEARVHGVGASFGVLVAPDASNRNLSAAARTMARDGRSQEDSGGQRRGPTVEERDGTRSHMDAHPSASWPPPASNYPGYHHPPWNGSNSNDGQAPYGYEGYPSYPHPSFDPRVPMEYDQSQSHGSYAVGPSPGYAPSQASSSYGYQSHPAAQPPPSLPPSPPLPEHPFATYDYTRQHSVDAESTFDSRHPSPTPLLRHSLTRSRSSTAFSEAPTLNASGTSAMASASARDKQNDMRDALSTLADVASASTPNQSSQGLLPMLADVAASSGAEDTPGPVTPEQTSFDLAASPEPAASASAAKKPAYARAPTPPWLASGR